MKRPKNMFGKLVIISDLQLLTGISKENYLRDPSSVLAECRSVTVYKLVYRSKIGQVGPIRLLNKLSNIAL